MNTPKVCFIDVDHTITRRSTGRYFAIKGVQAGYIRLHALLSIPAFVFRYRLGMIRDRDLQREFGSLAGVPKKELDELGEQIFSRYIIRDIFPEAQDLIAGFQKQGTEVVIATSSMDVMINPLARHLGIETVLASSFEYSDGVCTGRFKGKLYFGENKRREALDFLSKRGIGPGDCAFYSDSIHDLPLLEAVGTPVTVNPDIRLKALARKRGWEILRFR